MLEQTLCKLRAPQHRIALAKDDKLIPPHAAHHVAGRPKLLNQVSEFAQYPVASRMPSAIVDGFELIDVNT